MTSHCNFASSAHTPRNSDHPSYTAVCSSDGVSRLGISFGCLRSRIHCLKTLNTLQRHGLVKLP